MKFYKYLSICSIVLSLFACSKEDNSLPESVVTTNVSQPTPTMFIFTGDVEVDKYDSNSVQIANYTLPGKVSTLNGSNPDYTITNNINGTSLKCEVINTIEVYIPVGAFFSFSSGTGVFINGVYNGFYSTDSLSYQVMYTDYDKNNIYLNFRGELTDSY